MQSGAGAYDPTIVAAFKAALVHQGLVVVGLLVVLAVAWRVLRLAEVRRAAAPASAQVGGQGSGSAPAATAAAAAAGALPEPAGRRFLRIAFGLLWLLDGVLQGQAAMPVDMAQKVIQPAAASSPAWVQHLVGVGVTIWSFHPVQAAASAVWIQVGLGVLLLVAPRGRWSRLAGVVGISWGLVVWVFGEAFGGIFAPGLSVLFGAPGAAIFYVLAGAAVALPDRAWQGRRLGRRLLGGLGAFLLAMGVLQAWPGRGFWTGTGVGVAGGAAPGPIGAMAAQMAGVPQPQFLSSSLRAFAAFAQAHGFAVNLVVVVALVAAGAAFLSGRPRPARLALAGAAVFFLADWILVEDLGFLGGVGTDPNGAIPLLALLAGGYKALTAAPGPGEPPARVEPAPGRGVRWSAAHGDVLALGPTYLLRSLAAVAALGVVLLGAVPMAVASASPNADPIVAQAVDGTPAATTFPAPGFHLVDQAGHAVSLTGLRGKTLVVTFLDPVCTSDCPLIAQELRRTDVLLGRAAARVELVAIDVNPLYEARPYLVAFDRQERLDRLPNWRFLTGGSSQLARVWNAYGIEVERTTGGAMVAHTDLAFVVDARGQVRWTLDATPGAGTPATQSSFAVTLADAVRQTLGSS